MKRANSNYLLSGSVSERVSYKAHNEINVLQDEERQWIIDSLLEEKAEQLRRMGDETLLQEASDGGLVI